MQIIRTCTVWCLKGRVTRETSIISHNDTLADRILLTTHECSQTTQPLQHTKPFYNPKFGG